MIKDYDRFAQALLARINQPELFSARNGIRVTALQPGLALGELRPDPGSLNPRHIVHGGCLCSLMDTVAGIAACSEGRSCVTLNCTTNYIRPLTAEGVALCRAVCVKSGRSICVVECSVTDEREQLITTGTYTFYLKEPLSVLFGETEGQGDSA